jgi:hypothetical protein
MRPEIFGQLIEGLRHPEPAVRMRAADAAEKASVEHKQLLHPFKAKLMELLTEATQQELRWHLAQMVPRLALTGEERHGAAGILRIYLGDRSSIVRTFAMQALADLAERDTSLQPDVVDLIRRLTKTGSRPCVHEAGSYLGVWNSNGKRKVQHQEYREGNRGYRSKLRQGAVDQVDGDGSFAHSRGNAFHIAGANIAHGKHTRKTGLQH